VLGSSGSVGMMTTSSLRDKGATFR